MKKHRIAVYYIKCASGYWEGLSHLLESHTYTAQVDTAAKYFKKEDAEKMVCWHDPSPLSYMRIKQPLEPFEIIEKIYEEL